MIFSLYLDKNCYQTVSKLLLLILTGLVANPVFRPSRISVIRGFSMHRRRLRKWRITYFPAVPEVLS